MDNPEAKIKKLQQLLHAMKSKGVSQKYIAEKAGVTQSAVCRLLDEKFNSKSGSAILLWEFAMAESEISSEPESQDHLVSQSQPNRVASTSRTILTSSQFFRFRVTECNAVEIAGEAGIQEGFQRLGTAPNATRSK